MDVLFFRRVGPVLMLFCFALQLAAAQFINPPTKQGDFAKTYTNGEMLPIKWQKQTSFYQYWDLWVTSFDDNSYAQRLERKVLLTVRTGSYNWTINLRPSTVNKAHFVIRFLPWELGDIYQLAEASISSPGFIIKQAPSGTKLPPPSPTAQIIGLSNSPSASFPSTVTTTVRAAAATGRSGRHHNHSGGSGGVRGAAIAAVVIGVLFGISLIAGLALVLVMRRRKARKAAVVADAPVVEHKELSDEESPNRMHVEELGGRHRVELEDSSPVHKEVP